MLDKEFSFITISIIWYFSSVSNWDEFISSNLIKKCCDLLQTDFDIGASLFIRHQVEF